MGKTEIRHGGHFLGLHRVISPTNALPQQATKLDTSFPAYSNELIIDVKSLNVDSASFKQIWDFCENDIAKTSSHIFQLVSEKGKMHNPVTGSGGMLLGKVTWVGPDFPVHEKPVKVGDSVATLVSLTLTPLKINRIVKISPSLDRVDIEGHAILFPSGLFTVMPKDFSETTTLAVMDVAGAPAQTAKIVKNDQTVVVIGGAGKSGLLVLAEARRKKGVRLVAVDYSERACAELAELGLADQIVQADARNAVEVMQKVETALGGKRADLVINVANIPETELGSILACKDEGIVYFFSMATSFQRCTLGAEGVGADVQLMMGNGYTKGHAESALQVLRDYPNLRTYFEKRFG